MTPTHVGVKSNIASSMDVEPQPPRGAAHQSNKRNHLRNGGNRRKLGKGSPKVMTEKELAKLKESSASFRFDRKSGLCLTVSNDIMKEVKKEISAEFKGRNAPVDVILRKLENKLFREEANAQHNREKKEKTQL